MIDVEDCDFCIQCDPALVHETVRLICQLITPYELMKAPALVCSDKGCKIYKMLSADEGFANSNC